MMYWHDFKPMLPTSPSEILGIKKCHDLQNDPNNSSICAGPFKIVPLP